MARCTPRITRLVGRSTALLALVCLATPSAAQGPRALFTTDAHANAVNQNRFEARHQVYLNGGPSGPPGGLADGDYVFQVTDPSGHVLLSSDPAACRVIHTEQGRIVARRDLVAGGLVDHAGADDACHRDDSAPGAPSTGAHDTNPHPEGGLLVQLAPFLATPSSGGVYKVWLLDLDAYADAGGDLSASPAATSYSPDPGFSAHRDVRTDNFKVRPDRDNRPPTADAGDDQTAPLGAVVTLDGTGSYDPDGDPLLYSWTLLQVPAASGATLSDPRAARPTLVVDEPGSYVVELVVDDGRETSAPDQTMIDTANSTPSAAAGVDQSVSLGATVTLDGSGSSDADGDPLVYLWTLLEAPEGSTAALSDPTAVRPTFVADLPGSYRISLVVDDGTVVSPPDELVVTTENSAPLAAAGPDQTVPLGDVVTLDASDSSDVDGDALTYLWSLASTPEGSLAALSDQGAVSPSFVVDLPGDYVVQLVVSDGLADSTPDQVVISTENSSPLAAAGPDQTVAVGETVTLDGTGSSDADGDLITYSWSLLMVPASSLAALDDPSAPRPGFVADVAGDYVVQLVTDDGEASSEPDTVVVTAGNSRPVADAGPDQTFLIEEEEQNLIQLDGSGSFDVDGDALTFSWSIVSSSVPPSPFIDPPFLDEPSSVTPTLYVPELVADYVVQLIVSDGQLDSDPDTVSIEHENIAPFAHAGSDQTAFVGDVVQLDGSQSFDVNGDPLTFLWLFVSMPAGSQAVLDDPASVTPTFVFDVEGTYVVHLVVDDGQLDSDHLPGTSFYSNVTITTANVPPTADAGADQSVLVGDLVFLDGSGSRDPDGDPLTFTWALTSTPTGSATTLDDPTSELPSFEVDLAGTYMAQLIVNDGEADSAPDTVLISTIGSRPVADAGEDQSVFAHRLVVLDGTASSDADGDPLTYSWSILSAPTGSTASLDDPNAAQPTFFADLPGTYLVQLIVDDGLASSTADTVVIEALAVNTLRLVPDSPIVGIDRSIGASLVLGTPAPAEGLVVTLTSDDPTVAGIAPAELTLDPGEDSARVRIDGFAVGETSLRAVALDFNSGFAPIEITDLLISIEESVEVAPGVSASLPVSLSEPAPPGGLTLFLETEDPAVATITPTVFVPGGSQLPIANPQVTGVAIGETIAHASAERFAPDQADVRVTLELSFPPGPGQGLPYTHLVAFDTREVTLRLSAPAPPGGLVIDLSIDDTTVATVPPTVTAAAGATSVGVPVTGISDGETTLRAGARGVDEATAQVRVEPDILVSSVFVGRDLQRSFSARLGVPAPEGGRTVTITSGDPSRLVLAASPTETGVAEVSIDVPGGQSHAMVWGQALVGGGNVTVTASAPDQRDGTGTITLTASGFAWTTGSSIDVTTLDDHLPLELAVYPLTSSLGFFDTPPQELRPGVAVDVAATSSDPSVAAVLGSPVAIGAGQSQAQVLLDPLSAGATTVGLVTPTGFSTPSSRTARAVTVSTPQVLFGDSEVGVNLQIQRIPALELDPPAPIDVTFTVADPSIAIVSAQWDQTGSGVLVLPDHDSRLLGPILIQGLAVGTTTITIEAPGYVPAVGNVEVFPSGLRFTSALGLTTTTISEPLLVDLVPVALIRFNERVQEVRGGFSVEAEVTSSDPAVAAVLGPALVRLIPPGRIAVEVDGLSGGTSQLTIVQPPGFTAPDSRTQRPITVEQPRITVSSTEGSGLTDFRVGRDLQGLLGYRLGPAPPVPTDVVVTVDSPIATLSTDSTTSGTSSVTFSQVAGTNAGQLWVQGLSLGSTTITATADGYTTHVLELEISLSGFEITTPSADPILLNTLQPNVAVTVAPTPLDPVTLEVYRDAGSQPLRPGLSFEVPVVSSNPGVASITESPVTVASSTQNGFPTRGSTELDPLTAGATVVEALAPAGFSTPAFRHRRDVVVDAPDLLFPSAVSIGRDLQIRLRGSLELTVPEPLEVTITSSSPEIAIVTTDEHTVGSGSASVVLVPGQRTVDVWIQGLTLGTAQLTAQAPGFDDDVVAVRVHPSGFVHAGFNDFRLPVGTPPFDRQIQAAVLEPTTLDYLATQQVRSGISVPVTVTTSDPSTVGVLDVPITMEYFTDGRYQIEPLAVGSAALTVETPAGFHTPSERTTIQVTVDP